MRFMYESILLEDIEAVKRQYSYIPEEDFYKIIKIDPTYQDGKNSVGKYGKWLLGLYKKDNPLNYNSEDIYNILNLYNQYKNDRKKEIEKDINKFKSIEDLNDAVNNVDEAELSARQQEKEKRNSKDIKKIFEDNMWEVWVPQSYAGSCTLGKGTEWCTADSRTDDYYYEYTEQGPLYVFINKQNPKEKYQLHVETESFMDEDDDEADLEDVLATDDKLNVFVYKDIYGYKIDNNGNFIYNGKNQVPESATSVIVKQGVTSIGYGAFSNYKSLQSVTIPDSVTFIGNGAFSHCTSLQSIIIPDSVTTISAAAFNGCDDLKEVILENPNTKYEKNTFPEHTQIIKRGVNESLKANINEAIKVNDTLNPKLWDLTTNELLPDVKNQLMSIVEVFENYIDIPLNIVDIQLVGSNASFNYADTSDIDLHIIANFELTSTDTAILQALCDAKKTSFNKTYDIRIKGLEVEVYVQDINAGIVSNGIYSLCLDEWVKFPVPINNVVKHDNTIALKKWTDRINQVIATNNKSEIEDIINTLYLIRHNSIAVDGEYGAGNQLFKDIRSAGLLQQLKDALIKSTSDELSLEGFTSGQIINRLR